MGTQNSQKKSSRGSAKSETKHTHIGVEGPPQPDCGDEGYLDRSFDHVARVRAAKEAAQREMEEFGNVSEYDITILQGQLRPEPETTPAQGPLNFESDTEAS